MEYNLTFLEACEALKEGKCKEIENGWECRYRMHNSALSFINADDSMDIGIKLSLDSFLGKWRLVDEKPRTEERTFEYWLVIWNDGSKPTIYSGSPSQNVREIAQVIAFCEAYIYIYPKC